MTTPPRTPLAVDRSKACPLDLDCYCFQGHPGEHMYYSRSAAQLAPDPAPLDVERLARALAATDDAEWRLAIEDDYDPLNAHVEWWDTPRNLAAAIAREYAKEPQP